MTKGFLYTAFGAKYLAEARVSARSVKHSNPGAQICVVSDIEFQPDAEFDIILPMTPPSSVEKYADLDSGAYYRKIEQFLRSPFERTLYIDSDTFVTGSLDGVFELLDRYDLLITPDGNAEVNYKFEQTEAPFTEIPKAFGAFNTGVIGFRRSEAAQRFFQLWRKNHVEHVQHHTTNDQPSFRLSLYQSDVRYHVLPVTYNWFSWIPYFIPSGGRVMVMHGRNPWLFKWSHLLDAPTATIVGASPWRHRLIHFGSRALHWLSRKGILAHPKL